MIAINEVDMAPLFIIEYQTRHERCLGDMVPIVEPSHFVLLFQKGENRIFLRFGTIEYETKHIVEFFVIDLIGELFDIFSRFKSSNFHTELNREFGDAREIEASDSSEFSVSGLL